MSIGPVKDRGLALIFLVLRMFVLRSFALRQRFVLIVVSGILSIGLGLAGRVASVSAQQPLVPKITAAYACPEPTASNCFDATQGVRIDEYLVLDVEGVLPADAEKIRLLIDGKVVPYVKVTPSSDFIAVAFKLPTNTSVGFKDVAVGLVNTTTRSAVRGVVIKAAGPTVTPISDPGTPGGPSGPRPSLDGAAGGSVVDGLKNIADQFTSKGDLAQARTVGEVIVAIINTLLGLLFALVVLMVIYGGFLYVTAGGADDRTKKGKKVITQALIGMAIVVLAYVLVSTVYNALDGNI